MAETPCHQLTRDLRGRPSASQLSSAVKTGSTGTILGQYDDNYDAAGNRVSEETGQASLSNKNDD